jgi:hypothetical protein
MKIQDIVKQLNARDVEWAKSKLQEQRLEMDEILIEILLEKR